MPDTPLAIDSPQRWDTSFDSKMTDSDVERILSIPPFNRMDEKLFPKRIPLRGIIRHDMRIRRFRKSEFIVRQGDYGTSAFLIISGTVAVVLRPGLPPELLGRQERARKSPWRIIAQLWSNLKQPEYLKIVSGQNEADARVFLQDAPRVLQVHTTETMIAGELFGEIAALSRSPRAATVFGESDEAELLEIRWQGLRDLMRFNDEMQTYVDHIYKKNALATYLRNIPVFANLSKDAFEEVKQKTEFRTYGDYTWSGTYKERAKAGYAPVKDTIIAEEGDYPNEVIMIRSGFGRVTRKYGNGHRTLDYLGAGRYYGLAEIAHNWRNPGAPVPLQHTLRVIGYTHILKIPTKVMEDLVLPTIPKANLPPLILAEELPAARSVQGDAATKIDPDLQEFLTENRFFNGTATMVIDLDRCTRCDDCVRACAATHDNNPRFLRHGPTSGNIMVANACMHCSDPVCMIECPTGAIGREAIGGQIVINPHTCIGCQNCYFNCPYDAIRMVELRDKNGNIVSKKEEKTPVLKATKCDLCIDQIGGPACERACPHGALARVNLNDLDSFAPWMKR
jgi:Fe-S-cluster-containing dehydrogenase component/CRP-like cAMP-binding protein